MNNPETIQAKGATVSEQSTQVRIPRISVRNLGKSYGTGANEKRIIEGLSFTAYAGEFVCIVGPSGVGKTTLLRCLSGLVQPTTGVVEVDEEPISGPPRAVALVFQDYTRSLMPWHTAAKNVMLPLEGQGLSRSVIRERAAQALKDVGLAGSENLYPWQLSGGMQQRVAIARALAYQPEVLIMDEPFASVDAQTRFELEDLLLRLREHLNITILFVTHDIDESVYLGDRVLVLGSKPARVKEEIEITLPSPRSQLETRALPEFARARTHVLSLISDAKNG